MSRNNRGRNPTRAQMNQLSQWPGLIVSRTYADEKKVSKAIEGLTQLNLDTGEWHGINSQLYAAIAFVSGAALAGEGTLLLITLGGQPQTSDGDFQRSMESGLKRRDMVKEIGGLYASLLRISQKIGGRTYAAVRELWGPMVNAYLIGLTNLLNGNDRGESLCLAATGFDEFTKSLSHFRLHFTSGAPVKETIQNQWLFEYAHKKKLETGQPWEGVARLLKNGSIREKFTPEQRQELKELTNRSIRQAEEFLRKGWSRVNNREKPQSVATILLRHPED